MKKIRIRFALDLELIAKEGWEFGYDEEGELRLTTHDGESWTVADRDTLIREMIMKLEHETLVDDDLPWFVSTQSGELDGELP